MRKLLFVVALTICALGGVAVASALNGSADDQRPNAESQGPEFGSAPGTQRVSASTRPNAGPPWTVSAYETRSGKKCATTGQLVDGKLGRVDALDKRFRAIDLDEVPCADLGSLPPGYGVSASVTGFAEVQGGDVSLVWGVAESDVRHVLVTRSGGGSERRLTPGRDGAFITAYPGHSLPDTVTVEAVRADGSRKAYDFEPLKGVPSPEEIRRQASEHKAGHGD